MLLKELTNILDEADVLAKTRQKVNKKEIRSLPPEIKTFFKNLNTVDMFSTWSFGGEKEGKKFNEFFKNLGFTKFPMGKKPEEQEALGPVLNLQSNKHWKKIHSNKECTYYKLVSAERPIIVATYKDPYLSDYGSKTAFIGEKTSLPEEFVFMSEQDNQKTVNYWSIAARGSNRFIAGQQPGGGVLNTSSLVSIFINTNDSRAKDTKLTVTAKTQNSIYLLSYDDVNKQFSHKVQDAFSNIANREKLQRYDRKFVDNPYYWAEAILIANGPNHNVKIENKKEF